MHVEVGDILRLVLVNVSVREDNEPEEAITMVKVVDGTDTCTVGFVPRAFACLEGIKKMVNNCCIVLEVYNKSNKYKQLLSNKNFWHGIMSFHS
jgi:hypothetical protein